MKSYFVYVVECADGLYYTGITNDIERRLDEHNSGLKNSFTFKRRPVILKFYQKINDVNQAILFEKKIKKWSAKKKKALINGNFELLQTLAECRNATHFKYKPDD